MSLTLPVHCVQLSGGAPASAGAERDAALVDAARALLSADELARADRLVLPRLRDEFALARASLRALLAERTGVEAHALEFSYGAKGKPSLAGAAAGRLQFNVSHSGGLLAFTSVQGFEVGIDIEQHRPVRDLDHLIERFFSDEEGASLLARPEDERPRAFFDVWARKEAFIKADGRGMAIPLHSFQVSNDRTRAALLRCRDEEGPAHAWTLVPFDPGAGYSGAVAIRHAPVSVTVQHTTAAALLSST